MKCPHCGYENKEGAQFCNLCQKSFVKDDTELGGLGEPSATYGLDPLAEPSPEAKKAAENILRSQPTELNWFQRHLNWTWVLPQLCLIVAAMFIATGLIASIGPSMIMPPSERPSVLPSLPFSVFALSFGFVIPLLMAAAQFGIGAWVLKRKSRSLWWLLIFLIPSAASFLNSFLAFVAIVAVWIVFLRLENQSLPPPLPATPGSPSQPGSTIPPGLAPPGLGHRSDKYGP